MLAQICHHVFFFWWVLQNGVRYIYIYINVVCILLLLSLTSEMRNEGSKSSTKNQLHLLWIFFTTETQDGWLNLVLFFVSWIKNKKNRARNKVVHKNKFFFYQKSKMELIYQMWHLCVKYSDWDKDNSESEKRKIKKETVLLWSIYTK